MPRCVGLSLRWVNLAYMSWGTVFPGAACVVALVDRFAQHCHVFDIEGDSWRQRLEPEPSPPAPRGQKPKAKTGA